ncbi:MAG TPA: M56 family metallopeptidase, partial [Pirellulaceae bacterium]|nr:M56 family metallopeptidase [Pirellulaceae bacterium]
MPAWLQFDRCSTCVLALGHFLWQGALLGIAAAIALRVVTSTTARYWLSLSALVVMAACPVATFTWLAQQSRSSSVAAAATGTRSDARDARAVRSADESDSAIAARELPPGPDEPLDSRFPLDSRLPASAAASESPGALGMSTTTATASSDDRTWTRRLAPLVTSVYLGGVTLMLLRLALGLWGGRRLRRKATPVTEPALLAALQRQATALGLRLLPVLAYCERVTVPTVMGVLKPTILLPISLASGLNPEQLESVLAHELAHLRRYDH